MARIKRTVGKVASRKVVSKRSVAKKIPVKAKLGTVLKKGMKAKTMPA